MTQHSTPEGDALRMRLDLLWEDHDAARIDAWNASRRRDNISADEYDREAYRLASEIEAAARGAPVEDAAEAQWEGETRRLCEALRRISTVAQAALADEPEPDVPTQGVLVEIDLIANDALDPSSEPQEAD